MKNLILNFYIVALIALFISLPVIASANVKTHYVEQTPSVILKEEGLASIAEFKAYDANIEADTFVVNASKYEEPKKEEKPDVTPAVQSVAVSIEDVSPTPAVQPVELSESPASLTDEQIQFLGNCEAGMDPTKNTGNGYYGAFQFSYGTWNSMNTGYERADMAPLEVQVDAVQRLLQRSSIYNQFPGCARQMAAQGII